MKIGDIIEVPEIKPVIQMADTRDEKLRQHLSQSFILTSEIRLCLKSLLFSFTGERGKGCFVEGNYGSGKSHLLCILSLLLQYPEAWLPIIQQEPDFDVFREAITPDDWLVVEISLVEASARETLEEVLLEVLTSALKEKTGRSITLGGSRKKNFTALEGALKKAGLKNIIILVDELSEFLGSKKGQAFNEDVRFLQFMGEWGIRFPLWLIATLQEAIETVGPIDQDIFKKIKDRYPLRFSLGSGHIEELVSARLIIKKPEKEPEIREFYKEIKRAFPDFDVDYNRFQKLYPVHPGTINLLDHLKTLFSQHRGVVDFIHARLTGDESRNIPGMFHLPHDTLLTPDTIFDHFQHRIKESDETNPFHDLVYKYYEEEMAKIFPAETERSLAFKVIKILILLAIMPVRKRYTVSRIAEMLLYRVTDLEAGINYRYIRDILEKLLHQGAYITVEKGENELEDVFCLDLEADVNLIIRRKTDHLLNTISPDDPRIFDRLAPLIAEVYLPLGSLLKTRKNHRVARWQSTSREGYLIVDYLDRITEAELDEISREMAETELDFCIFMGAISRLDDQRKHLEEKIIPFLKRAGEERFLFWLPAPVREPGALMDCLAHQLLLEKFKEEGSDFGRRVMETLKQRVNDSHPRVKDIFVKAYFTGCLYSSWGVEAVDFGKIGLKALEETISNLSSIVLNRTYPKHYSIAPRAEILTSFTVQNLIEYFLRPGEIKLKQGPESALKRPIEAFIQPLGIAKAIPGGFRLLADPGRSEIVRELLSLVDEEKRPLKSIYYHLRKGPHGLMAEQFELLILALCFSGQLVPYHQGRRKPLEHLSAGVFETISSVSKGELLSTELREVIPLVSIFPRRFLQGKEFTRARQEETWVFLKEFKENTLNEIVDLEQGLIKTESYPSLKSLNTLQVKKDMENLKGLLNEIKVSYGSQEGLTRFLTVWQKDPTLPPSYQRFTAVKEFFTDHVEQFIYIYQYLHHQDLIIPEEEKYVRLKQLRSEILDLIEDEKSYYSPDFPRQINGLFNRFLEDYTIIYQKEHQRLFDPDLFYPYEKIRESQRYQILKRFSNLELVSIRHNLTHVERKLTGVLNRRCRYLHVPGLHLQPTCECGFRLGERLEFISVSQIESDIDKGIREYCEALSAGEVQEKIEAYSVGLKEVGKEKEAGVLKNLANFKAADNAEMLPRLDEMSRPSIVVAINEALAGRVRVITRDIDELVETLIDRSYPLKKLREIFLEWLERGERLEPDVYIKILSAGKPVSGEKEDLKWLSRVMDERFPELIPLFKKLGGKNFNLTLWTAYWLASKGGGRAEKVKLLGEVSCEREELGKWLDSLKELAVHLMKQNPEEGKKLILRAQEFILDRKLKSAFLDYLTKSGLHQKPLVLFEEEDGFPFIWKEIARVVLSQEESSTLRAGSKDLENLFQKEREKGLSSDRDKLLFLRSLSAMNRINEALDSLKKDSPEEFDFKSWEKTYREVLAGLFYDYNLSSFGLRRLGISNKTYFQELLTRIRNTTEKFEQAFQAYFEKSYPAWTPDNPDKPFFPRDIPRGIAEKLSKAYPDRPIYYFLMDGMRWDLWLFLKEELLPTLRGNYRLVKEMAVWAHPPTVTAPQLKDFIDGKVTPDEVKAVLHVDEPQGGYGTPHPEEIDLSSGEKLTKISFIDNKIHTSRDELMIFYHEVLQYLKTTLESRLESLPKKSLIVFFADHGFRENLKFSLFRKYQQSRYIHGDTTMWEVIVPLVAFLKI